MYDVAFSKLKSFPYSFIVFAVFYTTAFYLTLVFCLLFCLFGNVCCQASFFCLRKILPELTSVPIFLYFMWDVATAWLDKWCQVHTRDPDWQTPGF